MDVIGLSRLQFAVTTIYHFFFVPLTLGLSVLVATMETLYVYTGNETYKKMTKFWGTLFVINFVLGVVTGIVQEFQFGMNWSEYSRFVGDIFGVPLAIEALAAFFLESTFLGLWIFGWGRLSKRVHLATIWLVAIASNLSAYWILVANSFMQQPVGYAIEEGRAVMTDFFAVVFNPNIWTQFPHVLSSGFATAAFFIMGISAYHLVRDGKHKDQFRRSFQIAAIVGLVGVVGVIVTGHSQAQHMVESQPMKMAAAEAHWETEDPASMTIFTVGITSRGSDAFAVKLPGLLSLMACDNLDCEVQGINDLQRQYQEEFGPGNYIPPVGITYWSFRIMVGVGFLMLLIILYALLLVMGEQLENKPRFLKYFPFFIVLPYLANTAGWILTEVGRFPWIVYGLMTIDDGVSIAAPLSTVAFSLTVFTLIYGALMVAGIYLMIRYAGETSPKLAEPIPVPEPAASLIGGND